MAERPIRTRRDSIIRITVYPEELATAQAAAERAHLSLAAWCRTKIMEAARVETE